MELVQWLGNGLSLGFFITALWFIFNLSRKIDLLKQEDRYLKENYSDLKEKVNNQNQNIDKFNERIDKGIEKIENKVEERMKGIHEQLSNEVLMLNKVIIEALSNKQ